MLWSQHRLFGPAAVLEGEEAVMKRLRTRIAAQYGSKAPVVLDMFSGRGIIPLEAARAGASAIGTDLSPVATLAGRLLADYPLRDWSAEAALPYGPARNLDSEPSNPEEGTSRIEQPEATQTTLEGLEDVEPRLLADVRIVLAEVVLGDPTGAGRPLLYHQGRFTALRD